MNNNQSLNNPPDGQSRQQNYPFPNFPLSNVNFSLPFDIQQFINRQQHKGSDAGKAVIKLLKDVNRRTDLSNDDQTCSICFDEFEDLEDLEKEFKKLENENGDGNDNDNDLTNSQWKFPELLKGYDIDDPEIGFPADITANQENRYDLTVEDCIRGKFRRNRKQSNNDNDERDSWHYPVKLPQCEHIFGRSCIVEWLKTSAACPLCRREIPPELATTENTNNNNNMIFYPRALTEMFFPVDWTGPITMGYEITDPQVNFFRLGEGVAMGRRTGPPIPRVEGSDSNNDVREATNGFNSGVSITGGAAADFTGGFANLLSGIFSSLQ